MESEISTKLQHAFSKASFLMDGKLLIKNFFLTQHSETIIDLLTQSKRERGIILHHGTSLPLYFAAILACFKSFLSDDRDHAEFLDELSTGDLVLYENKRGVYDGIENGFIVIYNNDRGGVRTKNSVPVSLVNKIQPYYGNAKSLDGRGVRRKKYESNLISSLFNIESKEIKSVIRNAVVIVCDRQVADQLISQLSLLVDSAKAKLGDIFPAAYYTANDIHYYSGNSAKINPLIKFTNKLSVARELIIDDKFIETLLIDGASYFNEDISEITSIYNRTTLKSILMLGEICKGINSSALTSFEDLKLILWTKDKIILNNDGYDVNAHDECKRLDWMLNNLKNIQVEKTNIDFKFYTEIVNCKKELYILTKQRYESPNKMLFIKKSYWLLNLLERSFFPLSQMETLIVENKINAPSPEKELHTILELKEDFAGQEFESLVHNIIDKLQLLKRQLNESNPKFNHLVGMIKQNTNCRMAIIFPKAYYGKVFLESVPNYLRDTVEKCDFFTPTKYSSHKNYHSVEIIGVWDWSSFNPLLISNTNIISFLLYEHERKILDQMQDKTFKKVEFINKHNFLTTGFDNDQIHQHTEAAASSELEDEYIEKYLEASMNKLDFSVVLNSLRQESSGMGQQTSEIIKIATLDTGEHLLLTRYFTPYVFDEDNQIVLEKEVPSLNVGDTLIFTNYDSDTKDIVEKIMDIILESDNCDQDFRESYRKSLHWKRVLKGYLNSRRLGYRDLSYIMAQAGTPKHEVTLRTWLDAGSHVVGPRDLDSYKTIATITQDKEMITSTESFHRSTREVRTMRTRILKYLGKNIVQAFNKHQASQEDEILSELPIDLSKMSRIVQIEQISNMENTVVPLHLTNKPVTL